MKYPLFVAFVFFLASCTSGLKIVPYSSFGNDAVQYYTLNVQNIDLSQGFQEEDKTTIQEHGVKQARENVPTAVFYFDGNAPNINNAIGGLDATQIIQAAKPIAVVWITADGEIQFIQHPR